MNAIIVEDDMSIALDYEMMLNKLGINLMGTFSDGDSCVKFLKNNKPDFIILDLHLEGATNGLSLAKQIQHLYIPFIVVTGYPIDKLMNEAKELNAQAFLVKPINMISLEFEIKKIEEGLMSSEEDNYMTIKERGAYFKVPFKDIQYIEVEGNYVSIHTAFKKFILKKSLTKLIDSLKASYFMRVHRGTIVNQNLIGSIDFPKKVILLKNKTSIKIGKNYFADMRSFLETKNVV